MTIRHLYSDVAPALNLDFANTKRLDPRITFTRGSTGTYVDEFGVIKTAASNEARFDHDSDGNSLGLLIEESRTNLLTYSEQFDNAAWNKASATVTPNAATAPDGTITADKFIATATNSSHYIFKVLAVSSGTTTCSIYAKSAELSWVTINVYDGGAYRKFSFNVSTGEKGIVASGLSSSIEPCANGWYRISCTYTSTGANNSILFMLYDGESTENFLGDGTSGIYIWGAQLEAGSFPTSYIPTSGSTVTRSADVASMTGTNFSSWYNQTEGSWFVDSKCPVSSNNQWIFALNPSGTGEDMLYRGSTDALRSLARYRGDVFDTNDAPSGQFNKASLGYQLTSQASSYFNTVSGVYSSIAGNTGTPTSLAFGLTPGNSVLNGHISRLTYYPVRLPDATLQALTL